MAVEQLVRLTCDRCRTVMDEGVSPSKFEEDEAPVIFYMEGKEVGLDEAVSFHDVCEKCRERVRALIGQITLTKDDTPAPKGKKATAKKTETNGSDPAPPADGNEGDQVETAPN